MSHPFVTSEARVGKKPAKSTQCEFFKNKVGVIAAASSDMSAEVNSNSSHRTSSDVPYTKTAVYEAFKPLLRSLQVLGFYHCECTSNHGWQLWVSRIYCWIVTLSFAALTIMCILNLTTTTKITTDLFTLLISVVSYLLITFNGVSFILASHSRKSLTKFFICFSRLEQYGGPFIAISWLKRFLYIFCIGCWVSLITGMAFVAYLMSQNLFSVFMGSGQQQTTLMQVLFTLYLIFPTSCWIFTSCLEFSLGVIIYREILLFARSLKSKFVNGKVSAVANNNEIEKDRKRYLEMTRIIKAADNSLSVHQAAAFGCNVASICLQVYNICYYPEARSKAGAAGTYTFGLLICVVDIGVVCTSGILVTTGVCEHPAN